MYLEWSFTVREIPSDNLTVKLALIFAGIAFMPFGFGGGESPSRYYSKSRGSVDFTALPLFFYLLTVTDF